MDYRVKCLLGIICLGFVLGTSQAQAAPRNAIQPNPIYRDEGNRVTVYNTQCSSTAWTAPIVSSDTISRSIVYEAAPGNTVNVCISTYTATDTTTCGVSTTGVELAAGASLTDYGPQSLNCRCATGAANCNIKGYRSYDINDVSDRGNPTLQ